MGRELRAATGVLAACLLGTYSALALAGFVFDDVALVVQNTLTAHPDRWLDAFRTDLWKTSGVDHFSGYFRPLLVLDLMLDRALFGLSPMAHHLHSVAWHLLAVGLLLALLRQLLPPTAALAGAALFAMHPVQSEAVAWVAARNDLMATSFVLAAVLVLLPREVGVGRLVAGAALTLLGLLSKESAVLTPFALGLLDLARFRRLGSAPRYASCLLALGAWWSLRAAAEIPDASLPSGGQLAILAHEAPRLAAHYASLLLVPHPLTVGTFLTYLRESAGQYVLLAALVGLLLACARRGGLLACAGLLLAAAALSPAILAIAVRGQVGERYLYLPLAGLAITVASALPERRAVLWALAPVLAGWTLLLHERLPAWRSDLTLWEAAHRDSPSPYTSHSLAAVLVKEGRTEEAIKRYQAALEGPAPYHAACLPAVTLALNAGYTALAARGAQLVVDAHCPKSARLAGAAGQAALDVGDVALARRLTDDVDPEGDAALLSVLETLAGLEDSDPSETEPHPP